MNSFELNKIFGAILGTLVFVMGVGFIAEEIYAPIENRGATFELPEPVASGGDDAPDVPQVASIAARMQTASAEEGEAIIVRCQSCHDYSSANTNRVGPGIFGIMGNDIAHHDGYNYSEALRTLAAEEGTWSYEAMDAFLESPARYTPGTTMGFPGIASPEDRANLIAFLRENDDNPIALPDAPAEEDTEAAAETAEEPAAPAVDYAPLIAAADIELGASIAPRCQGCHDFSEANSNRMGPGLYEVVDRPIGAHEGYNYSAALAAHAEAGDVWTFANLDAFLESPEAFAPGTSMRFPGLADAEERIALIAWMREQAGTPVDLGDVAAATEESAEAGEEPAAAEDAAEADETPAQEDEAPVAEEPVAEEEAVVEEEAAEEQVAAETATEETAVAEAPATGGFTTEQQVAAGSSAYQQRCASCHGDGIVRSFAGYPNAGLFYAYISSAMPADAPASLPPQQYADIIAYLMNENGHPFGNEVLPADRAVLAEIDPDTPAVATPAAEPEAPAAEEEAATEEVSEDEAPAVAEADEVAEDVVAEEAVSGGFTTEQQVAAGSSAYQQRCASCHGDGIVRSFAGYPNAGLFYAYISSAMPADAPASLPPQQYADIIAYLMNENGHPIGNEVLPADRAVLGEIDPDAFAN